MVFKTENLIKLVNKLDNALYLFSDLLRRYEQVRIILRKAAYPE